MSNSLWLHGMWPTSLLLSIELSRQEQESGLLFPTSGDLLDPKIEHVSLAFPTLADEFFITGLPGSPQLLMGKEFLGA